MIYSKRLFNMSRIAWSISLLLLSCMSVFAQVPANDLVCNATPLTVNSTCVFTQYTTANATNSTGLGVPCFTTIGPDVWFSIVVPANGILNFDSNTGFITDGVMALYSGTCSGTLTELYCDDDGSGSNGLMPSFNTLGLTPGTTVYLRFYEYGGGNDGTFSLCVSSPAPVAPPANDNPCAATPLTVGATCAFTQYTNANATATAGVPAPSCSSYLGGDVWFSIVVPANGILNFDSNTGVITDGGMALYSGTCSGALTQLYCDDDGSLNGLMPLIGATGLTPGSTVYLRFWEFGGDFNGTFSLCVSSPSAVAPPANDNPCTAIPLTVGATCTFTQYTNAGATATAGVPAPSCSSYLGGDVWFSIVVPANGILNFNSNTGIITDGGMALYSGTCSGTLTELYCDDDGSLNGLMPLIGATGLTPGSTVYLRFWEFGGDNNGTFSLCVSSQTIAPPPTGNGDDCANSSPFCTGTNYNFSNNTNITSLGTISCLLTSPNPVWYYLEVDNAGNLDIDISQYDLFNNPIDVDFVLWGPFTNLANGCSQIQSSSAPVVDCSYSFSAFEQANIPNAQTGEIYILLLTNFSNTAGYITFNSTAGSVATTNCDILCNLTSLTAIPTSCNSITNTYNVSGQVTVTNPPESGILSLTSSCGGTTTLTAPFSNPINYTISSINAVSGSCNVVATFSADPTCSLSSPYTAPAACASVSLNCPDYANSSSSPTTACSNQTYYLDVANTVCAGQTFFSVAGNYGSQFGDEISWTVSSNLSGTTLASGIGNLSGANFNFSFGPFNPAIHGTIFTLNVLDSFGDGFNGVNGQIYVSQGGGIVGGPIAGAIGFGGSTIFGLNISISPATITVTTPAGNVVQTVQNCNDFRVPISIENPNFCNTINVTLPWSVTCNSTGAVLASGSNSLIVYPTLPNSSNDVVSIQYNSITCDWDVTGNNDCDAGDIGTIFTISPDPASLTNTGCTGGNQVFDVNYIGIGGGPNCCSTGGTLIPIQINNFYPNGSYGVASSPFGGINNAAYLNIPPNTVGGNASSLQLNINMNGFCMDPVGPNAGADYSYWVTVIVDGQIISDLQTINPGPSNYSQTINIANIPGGFNSSMDIDIYIYPNLFANAALTQFQTYNPIANCTSLGNGIWTSSSITANLAVTFEEFEPTPATCLYPANAAFVCCSPTTVSNGTSTICSGGSISAVTTWQNSVVAANPTCVVYSSVLPLAGTTAPDNILPNGINSTATPIVQTVSAYAYCDTDNSGDINLGDTYTLISNYTLTVNPNISAGTSSTTSICASGASVNLFGLLGGTPSSTGAWTGPSALSGGNNGTFNPLTNTAGIYTYTVNGTSPCPNVSSTVTVTLSAAPSATISYAGSPFCKSISTSQSVTLSGATGGTYSSTAGLTINASTGAITPSTSSAGSYSVTYTVAAAGGCLGVTATTPVEIIAIPDVATNLPSYSTCTGPTLATAGGYTINITSTTPGATFNWSGSDGNSGTGTPINYPIANNTCSDQTVTFTITSTFNGCTSAPINRVLTLRPNPIATFTVSTNPICLGSIATVTFTGTSCPGSAYNWTWPSGVNVLSGSGAGPYTISFNSAGLYNIRHQIVGPASLGSCTSLQETVPVTVVDPANAGTNGSTTVCNTSSPVNLFSLLGGAPATSGTWSGPSALSGGQLGTFNPASNVAGVYSYTVSGTLPCPNASATVTISFNSNPVASSSGTTTICSNQPTALTLSSTIVGTTYAWTVVQTGVTGASSGSGSSIAQTLTTTGAVSGTAVYTVTPTANGCPGLPITITVTVNPLPNAGTNGAITVCSNSTNVNLFNSLLNFPTTGGTWSGPSSLTGASLGTFIPGTNTAGTYTYTLTSAGCPNTANVVVTVNPAAVVNAGSAQPVCSGSSVTLAGSISGGASTGTWSAPSGSFSNASSLTSTYTPSITTGTVTLTLSSIDPDAGGPCTVVTSTVVITVSPTPNVTTTGTTTICSNQTTALTLTSLVAGTSFSWTVVQSGVTGASNASGNSIAQTLTNSGVVSGTAIYTVTPIANGCSGTPTTITVTVNPIPVASFLGITPICSTWSPAITLSSNLSGTTYAWTVVQTNVTGASNGSGSSINQTLTNTGIVDGTAVYTVTPTANSCPGAAITITITVKPKPVASTLGGSYSICSGPTLATANSPSIQVLSNLGVGTTFAWSGSDGTSGTSNPISYAIPNNSCADQLITYSVIPTYNGCVGSATIIPLTVHPNPIAAFTISPSIICQNTAATVTFTGSACASSNYTWTWPTGATVLSGTGAGPYSINFASAGNLSVSLSLTNAGGFCAAQTATVPITINASASATAGTDIAICSGSTINLAGIIGGSATSATWSASSGTFSDVNSLTSTYTPSITTGVVQLTLITNDPDGAGPCTFAVSSFNVTVNLAASISAGPNQTICSGNIAQLNGFVTGSAFLGTWSAPSGTFSSATLQNAIYTPPANASGNYILTYTSNDPAGVCPAVSSTVTVTVNPAATVAIGFFSQAICSGSSINLPGSFGGGATSATWSAPSGTFGNPNLAVTSYTPSITSGTVNITLTTNDPDGSGPCLAASTSRQIDVTQQPNATLTYPGSPYCQNETTNPLPIIVGTPGGTFSVNPISGLDIVSIGQISPSSSLAGTYTITYTIGSGGGCPAFVCSTQVVIYNQPPAPLIAPTSICAGIPQTVVASNGTWFGFSVDGIEVQAPSANNTYITPALALNSQVCVTSYPPSAFVFDGLINEPAWGPAWAYSTGGPASGFGANNIDALYLKDRSGYLFGGIAGRVQDNSNNRVLMFLDTKAGGFNSLAGWTNRNNSPYYSIRNLDAGITFDAGFEPDYILAMNQASGLAYFDLYDMQNNTNVFLGDDVSSNFLGYTANAGTGNYGEGFEFAIPMSAISNPVGSIQAFVMLVNDPGVSASTTLSNQFLTRANSGETNYGNGFVDFGNAVPNPISYSLSPECSTQTCIIASASSTTVTGFSYVSPLCQNASNPSPTFVSGYTPGGTFSANSINLSINPSTGLINLAASLPGTYIITYSIAASSCSPAGSSTFSFTINASITPVTGFTYTTPVCKNGTNPLVIPASGFTSGGSYSYIAIPSGLSTGLSLNTSTGAINLASSTPGTYTVTYSVVANGCQTAGSTSFTLTINPIPTTSSIFHD